MRKSARAERARQIEETAYALLDQHGLEGLSIQALAKAARASNETLYRWYGDKTGLIEALIRRNSRVVQDAISTDEDTDAIAALGHLGPVLLTMLLGPRAIALNRAAATNPAGPLGRALAREGRDTIAPRVVSIMERAISQFSLGGGTAQDMAETWFSLLIGDLQVRRVTGALAEPHAEYINHRAAQALDRLRGLFPADSGRAQANRIPL